MKKRVLTTILAGVLAVSAFAGCGSSNTAGNAAADNNAAAETNDAAVADTTAAESEAAESVADTQTTEGGTITVAASATPHAEILEEAKKILADQGWDLEITIFDDYVLPNEGWAANSGRCRTPRSLRSPRTVLRYASTTYWAAACRSRRKSPNARWITPPSLRTTARCGCRSSGRLRSRGPIYHFTRPFVSTYFAASRH